MAETNFGLYESSKPKDRTKARVGATLALIVIILILLFPFFTTDFPIPEAEGAMVSFGNVDLAGGGDNLDPNTPTSPNTPPPPEPDKPDEVDPDVVDDPQAVPVPKEPKPKEPKPKPTETPPKPKEPDIDPNALFPPKPGGKGTGSGPGQQGRPDGQGDDPLARGTGGGDKGDGTGKVGNRSIRQRCNALGQSTNWTEEGTVWVFICVSEQGKVVKAEAVTNAGANRISTVTSQNQRRIAENCAREYQYEPAPGMGEACGSIPIIFRKQ